MCVSTSLSQDHPQLDTNVICATIFPMVQADLTISIKILQGAMKNRFGFKTSYRKAWLTKQNAIIQIFGDWEESYNELLRWLQDIQTFMLGIIFELSTLPYYVGNFVDHNSVMFHYLFCTYPPCIEALKYYKSLISVNGTHLYGENSGTLLMVIVQDGNSNILHIAFCCSGEGDNRSMIIFLD